MLAVILMTEMNDTEKRAVASEINNCYALLCELLLSGEKVNQPNKNIYGDKDEAEV